MHLHCNRTSTASRLLALVAVAALTAAAMASPQAPADLQQQLQTLERRVKDLEALQAQAIERNRQCAEQLAKALERIQELETALAARDGAVDPGRVPLPTDATAPGQPDPAAVPPPAPATPAAPAGAGALGSSASLLEAVRARFAADFAGRPSPREGVNDERHMRLWTTEIERWANVVNRDLRRPIIWTVRVVGVESAGRSYRLDVVCVDPASHADIGRPFSIQLQSVQATSWEQSQRMGRADADFTLRGVLIPQIVINPTRYEVGPFDQPPFIGTFLEFGFRINVTSLIRVDDRPAPGGRRAPSGSTPQPSAPGSPAAPGAPGAPADGTAPGATPPSTP